MVNKLQSNGGEGDREMTAQRDKRGGSLIQRVRCLWENQKIMLLAAPCWPWESGLISLLPLPAIVCLVCLDCKLSRARSPTRSSWTLPVLLVVTQQITTCTWNQVTAETVPVTAAFHSKEYTTARVAGRDWEGLRRLWVSKKYLHCMKLQSLVHKVSYTLDSFLQGLGVALFVWQVFLILQLVGLSLGQTSPSAEL